MPETSLRRFAAKAGFDFVRMWTDEATVVWRFLLSTSFRVARASRLRDRVTCKLARRCTTDNERAGELRNVSKRYGERLRLIRRSSQLRGENDGADRTKRLRQIHFAATNHSA